MNDATHRVRLDWSDRCGIMSEADRSANSRRPLARNLDPAKTPRSGLAMKATHRPPAPRANLADSHQIGGA